MAKLIAMAIPVLPGKTPQWKKFSDELKGNRYNDFQESRKKLGVRERTFLQTTPQGRELLRENMTAVLSQEKIMNSNLQAAQINFAKANHVKVK